MLSELKAIREAEELARNYGAPGSHAIKEARKIDDPKQRLRVLLDFSENIISRSALGQIFNPFPVDFETFMTDPRFLGDQDALWPEILKQGIELNYWEWSPEFGFQGRYIEAVLSGGIGVAKTTLALFTEAYQLYLVLCMRDPHRFFELTRHSEILIVFQSATKDLARGVDYQRFASMLENSPWFKKHAPFDPRIRSELVFPRNIKVKPLSGADTAALGQNIIGGILDEVNYMILVEQSKRSLGQDTEVYDQAKKNYDTIARRRQSRFMKRGWVPGMLCIVSSKKYPGQFTDEKMLEAKTDKRIFVYDKRLWEVKPKGSYSKESFWLDVGEDGGTPRIYPPGEKLPKTARSDRFVAIPIDFWGAFQKDPYGSVRDIAGISIYAAHPFFSNQSAVRDAFPKDFLNIFEPDVCDLQTMKLQILLDHISEKDLAEPYYAHVDLGLNKDRAGLAVGRVKKFEAVVRSDDKKEVEILPVVELVGVLSIPAPPGGEIQFAKIREIFYALRKLGMGLRWISYDTWQSVDSQQTLRQRGFITGNVSLDKTMLPYDMARGAINDNRVIGPYHPVLLKELAELQVHARLAKVDHAPRGSKDLADAVAGVICGLTGRREIWAHHGIPTTQIPPMIRATMKAFKGEDTVEPIDS